MSDTTGTVEPQATGTDPAPVATPQPTQASGTAAEFETRMRNEPDFALAQYNKMKSENTKLFQKQQALKSLTDIADQLGGAQAARDLIFEYDRALNHPDVVRVRDHLRAHGTLPTATTQRPDSKDFDELFPDPQAQELTALKNKVNQLEQQQSHLRGSVGKQQVTGMLQQLRTEIPDGFDEFILPALNEQFDNWSKNAPGRDLLATLNYEHLKTIAGKAIVDHQAEIYERMHERKLGELKRGSTGLPAGNLSTGRERAATGAKHMNAVEALMEFKRQFGPIR